ncbi:hypothetical protein Trydic_g23199, partial [Trypoxylus dichotomus]
MAYRRLIIEESPQRGEKRPSIPTKKPIIEDLDPRPGTSRDDEISDLTEPQDSKCQKIMNMVLFLWAFKDSVLVSLTSCFNSLSRDYRYVVKVLGREKKLLKETNEYTKGIRMGRSQMWQPANSYHSLLNKSRAPSVVDLTPTIGTFSPSDSYRLTLM